jgi:hypothetical protein
MISKDGTSAVQKFLQRIAKMAQIFNPWRKSDKNTEQQNEILQASNEAAKPLYLAKFENQTGQVLLSNNDNPQGVSLRGEIVIVGYSDGGQQLIVKDIQRVALRSEPMDDLKGAICLAGPANEVQFELGSAVGIDMRLYYPLLSDQPPALRESDAVYPPLEIMKGKLTWNPGGLSFSLTLKASSESRIKEASFESQQLSFAPLGYQDFSESQANSLTPCNTSPSAGNSHKMRELHVRFFGVNVVIDQTLKNHVQNWIDAACEVWCSKGGIRIVPKPNATIDPGNNFLNGIIQTEDDEKDVPDHVGKDDDRIDIYLVKTLAIRKNGGITHNSGTSNAFIILEVEKAKHNKYLLSHEIGHVLGLCHPDTPADEIPNGHVQGSYCSVMVADKPNSSRNRMLNFNFINTSSLPLTPPEFVDIGLCQPSPDDGDNDPNPTFSVRDYPYDDGIGAVIQALADQGLYSDVWNSVNKKPKAGLNIDEQYEDNSPMLNDNNSPKHISPTSAGPNYMCVRLHTCKPLPHALNVYLYWEGNNGVLSPLVNVVGPHLPFPPTVPRPGFPITKFVQWNIPPNQNNFSVFAVAVSAQATPPVINNISDLSNWAQLVVAQRKIQVQGT